MILVFTSRHYSHWDILFGDHMIGLVSGYVSRVLFKMATASASSMRFEDLFSVIHGDLPQ